MVRLRRPRSGEGQRRPSGAVEVAVVLVGLAGFTRLHAALGKDVAAATANAKALQSLERVLRLDLEHTANRWLVEHPALIPPAVFFYRSYYLVVLGVLVWIFLRHRDIYLKARRTLLLMAALALPVFWALPLSPPRFALPGIVDIVAEHDLLPGAASRDPAAGENHYSAMPSLHVGWSAWCAYAASSALTVSHPRLARLPWLFPVLMAADVLVTGNHYVLDVVGSGVLLAVSVGIARVWQRSLHPLTARTHEPDHGTRDSSQ